jgi:hypothetical protein
LRLGERRWARARPVRLRLAGRTLVTNTVNLAVAVTFAVMGGFVIYLAGASRMTGGPGFQVWIGERLGRGFGRIGSWLEPVPEPLLGLLVLGIAAGLVYATLADRRRSRRTSSHACPHHDAEEQP